MVTARCRFRGLDGVTRQISATGVGSGRTEKLVTQSGERAAKANLLAKMGELKQGTEDLNSESRISHLAELWFTSKHSDGLKYRTIERARSVLDNHVIPSIGGLRLREASTAKLDIYIRKVAAKSGPATAVIVRSVLSGMFSEAQRYDAVVTNPVTATRVPKRAKSEIRAMSYGEFMAMRAHAEGKLKPLTRQERLDRANGDSRRMGGANRAQTPLDVIDFLIATGARASEVLGLCWEDVHLDGDVPFVRIHQQVIREKERGLVLAPTKERDIRLLALPGFAVEMLRRRQELPGNEWGAVFTNVRNNLFDPSNVRKVWRGLFAGSEWDWVSQKTLRKTVATVIDLELGSEVAAKQLGHTSDAMTKRHYIAPSKLPQDQRLALEKFGA
jgi:integrase